MIRQLRLDEMPVDMVWGSACYQELHFGRDFDCDHFCRVWDSFYKSNSGTVLVEELEGEKIGVIGGCIYIDPFDRMLVAQELIWYIIPQYRNLSAAKRLLYAFEQWASDRGAKYIRCSAPHEKHGLSYLLERSKYNHLETMYEKVLL